MSTLFESIPGAGAAVATHVLAIGIGAYPYLIGGSSPVKAANPLGLKQLSSPPISTSQILKWFLAPSITPGATGFTNPDCPLGSVEALISSPAAVQIDTLSGPQVPEAANIHNIKQAFKRWMARLKTNADNVGVFYFCGHGVSVASHYLLAENFGEDDDAPWECAFDLSSTIAAVEREVSGSTYFLIDACRSISRDIALTIEARPQPLKAVAVTKPVARKSLSLIEATGEGEPAFATQNNVSRFTEALLAALANQCGIRNPGSPTWDVDGETLASAVRKLLERGNKTSGRRQVSDQRISGIAVPLTRSAVVPSVAVEIDLSPEELRQFADFTLLSAKGVSTGGNGATGAFRATVSRGIYTVTATARNSEFGAIVLEDEEIQPPLFDLLMKAVTP